MRKRDAINAVSGQHEIKLACVRSLLVEDVMA